MPRFSMLAVLASGIALGTSLPAAGDTAVGLETIMAHPDWLGRAPEEVYWADDGHSFYYQRKVEGSEQRELFQAALDGETVRTVADGERGTIDVDGGSFSRDFNRKVYSRRGDLYWKELASGTLHQLTRTAVAEERPFFTADGNAIAFERDGTFFVRQLANGLESQVADVRAENDPEEEEEPNFLAAQQQRLFDFVSSQKEKREAQEQREQAEQAADLSRPPLPFYLGDEVEIIDQSLSPNARWLLVTTRPSERDAGDRTPMSGWVTDSGDVETEEVRPKVGHDEDEAEQFLLLDLQHHSQHPLDLSGLPEINDDPLAALKEAAAAHDEQEQTTEESETTEARPVQLIGTEWSRDGAQLAIMLRSLDNKDRWIAAVDFDSTLTGDSEEASSEQATLRPLHHLHDPAWINWRYNDFGWLYDDETLYYLSEEEGYSGLYTIQPATETQGTALVSGDFVVSEPQLSRDGRSVYYRANQEHPGIYEISRVALVDGLHEQITALGGNNSALLSPAGDRLLIEHSSLTHPPELYLQELTAGGAARQVTTTTSAEFLAIDWTEPEVIEIPSTHVERPIFSRLYLLPTDADTASAQESGTGRPAVVFVHGAGYLQNAHLGWSGYFREFMFHTLLTRRGYVVLDMDYRASAGYGRDWRTAIYRQMGTPELEDLQDGVAWLVENANVDPERIGVYGGSYGGFMALMALFKDPQLFAAGAALRPVTDWAHYNHGYTSNILNTPEIDPEAYANSSPIEFAAGLENPLLICAPMLDDNVLFQDTVRLVQRLIELEKTNFETAIFPVEPHGFREPSSWLNEYRRIYDLFERYVR